VTRKSILAPLAGIKAHAMIIRTQVLRRLHRRSRARHAMAAAWYFACTPIRPVLNLPRPNRLMG
jgi:hypothetical protein